MPVISREDDVSHSGGSGSLDLRLIPEFDGSASQNISEWLDKLELVCQLRNVTDVSTVIPLRLSGGAFAVYQQLAVEDRNDADKVKPELKAAFGADRFTAYERFSSRKLQPGESPYIYLADLRRLASLFGGVPDAAITCVFVAGLPAAVRQLLRAASRVEALDLGQVLSRARILMQENPQVSFLESELGARASPASRDTERPRCFSCNSVGHFAREFLMPISSWRQHGIFRGGAVPSFWIPSR